MNQEREAVAPMEIEAGRKLADWLREREDTNYAALVDRLTSAAELALRSGGEGWRLVPVEPTEAMIEAYCAAHESLGFTSWANASFVWPRMLSAAPSPSTHGEG